MARPSKKDTDADQKILDTMLERFKIGTDEWREIRDEAAVDMRYVSGDCWDPKEKQARKDVNRPALEVDEVNQYLNQLVNDIRQNKRGIKASPRGNGANDQTAAFRQGKIRDIEYQSNAQQAYTCMGENAFQRSYGFLRIKPKYVDEDKGFDQELIIEPIVNPDCVTPDPFHQRPDGADLNWLFYREQWRTEDFTRNYPDAKVTDFAERLRGPNGTKLTPWIGSTTLHLGEYWTKDPSGKKTLYLVKPATAQGQPIETEQAPADKESILKHRQIDQFQVMQYLTNGVEILERTEWPGQSIPFVTCYGKVMYLTADGSVKKRILSLIRLARSPQMLYAYYRTKQAEIAKMIPLLPVVGYKGQFRGVESDWQKASDEPMPYLEMNATTEQTGAQILPPPARMAYDAGAHLQSLELVAEGARRAIQAAMGIAPLPTQAQRKNEKSGVALKQIEDSAQKGSFHFIDHYDEAITRTGAILNELIPHYYDTARDTSIRKPDDSVAMVRINDPAAKYSSKLEQLPQGQPEQGHAHIDTSAGDHDITLSVGPAMSSEREASSEFADSLIGSEMVPQIVGPQKAARILASAIRLKGLGPIGDEMAEIIDPKQDGKADPAQLQQQMQEMHAKTQEMGAALQQAAMEKQAKTLELASKEKIAGATLDFQRWKVQQDNEAKIATAELSAKVDRLTLFMEERERLGSQDHEAVQNEHDRLHEAAMAAVGHDRALEAGQAQAGNQAALADQGHDHALEQGDASAANTMAAQAQAAELAPEPEASA
jgi:hypothetical protein